MSVETLERRDSPRTLSPEGCAKVGTIACSLCNACPLAALAPKPPDVIVSASNQQEISDALGNDEVKTLGFDGGDGDQPKQSSNPLTTANSEKPPKKVVDALPKQTTSNTSTPAPNSTPKPRTNTRQPHREGGETLWEVIADTFFTLVVSVDSLKRTILRK